MKISKAECLETKYYKINNSNINFEDEVISGSIIDVKFTEYAPKVFQQLRLYEDLVEDEILE
jgi:hypothetical protein